MEETMFKHIRLYVSAALVSFAMVGPSAAQTGEKPNQARPVIQWPQEQIDEISGIKYESFGTAEDGRGATRPVQAFLTDIVTWLSINFGLPVIHDHPRVELAPAAKLASLRYKSLLPDRRHEDSV